MSTITCKLNEDLRALAKLEAERLELDRKIQFERAVIDRVQGYMKLLDPQTAQTPEPDEGPAPPKKERVPHPQPITDAVFRVLKSPGVHSIEELTNAAYGVVDGPMKTRLGMTMCRLRKNNPRIVKQNGGYRLLEEDSPTL